MKKILFITVLILLTMPFSADAARLWSGGFELNSCVAAEEVTACTWDGSETATIVSTPVRTGTYSNDANASI
ncbi:MAG: hypothetical protein AAB573_00135 [Patescibacteria group bacterium]